MIFELKEKNNYLPDLRYGENGKELECFVPDGYQWRQINYGQGEGQVMIDGCEWGFYYTDRDSISIILHQGAAELGAACKFVNEVKNKVYGDKSRSTQVMLVADE